jgi:hypothetical protein
MVDRKKMKRVGQFSVGETVICDGVVAKITGFFSRRVVFLENLNKTPEFKEWATAKFSIDAIRKLVSMAEIENILQELGQGMEHFFANCMSIGLRYHGVPARAVVDENCSEIKIHVYIMAERPSNYATMVFRKNGDDS